MDLLESLAYCPLNVNRRKTVKSVKTVPDSRLYMFSVNASITAGGKMRTCGSADVRTCKMWMLMRVNISILPTQVPCFTAAT